MVGLDNEVRPPGESGVVWPLARLVFNRGSGADAGLSKASGGDLAGKLMTCSRKGAE